MITDLFEKWKSAPRVKSHTIPIIAFDLTAVGLTMVYSVIRQKLPMRYFGETGIITWFSFIQLLVIAGLGWKILRIRQQSQINKTTTSANLWKWITGGFVFLAIDEIAQIHEGIDILIHKILDFEPTRLTDSIDDIIVLMYVIFSLYILYKYRQEFYHYWSVVHLFFLGFLMLGIMIGLDVYSNDSQLFSDLFPSPEQGRRLLDWVNAIEESFKVVSEGFFIAAFLGCLKIAKKMSLNPGVVEDN